MKELNKRIITSIGLLIALLLSIQNFYFLCIFLFIFNWEVLFEFFSISKKIFKNKKLPNFIFLLIIILYLLIFSYQILNPFVSNNSSKLLLLFLIFSTCISSDIGGYIFGKVIKGKKLTKISPKKTYSGMIGSYLLSLIVNSLFFINKMDFMNMFVITLTISSLSQLGDLSISLMKRKAKIKDTGKLLPGHGGFLDRFDGLFLALPVSTILFN